ncbi:MAG: hypothetical protein VYC34_07910, partial [Planctomycetota bacterium]|nr:hypothetical protein [Planctomycetota bacterium]
ADEAGTAKESARQELATADGADTQRRSAATSQPLAPKAVVGDATRLRGPQTTRSAALADDAAEPEAAAAPLEITDEQIEEAYALLRERRLALALTIASDADESAITSNVAQSLGAESVEVPMTREAAASLLRAAAAHAVAIRIESLDEPVEIAGDASPHDLSWWHQPADRWSPRSVVPLTFERAAP